MKNWKDKQLFAVQVEILNEFPKCQDPLCFKKGDCANHKTACEWRETFGATPNLRQIVPDSWRCQQIPEEKLYGAVLTDRTLLKDRMSGPDWNDCSENDEDTKNEN